MPSTRHRGAPGPPLALPAAQSEAFIPWPSTNIASHPQHTCRLPALPIFSRSPHTPCIAGPTYPTGGRAALDVMDLLAKCLAVALSGGLGLA